MQKAKHVSEVQAKIEKGEEVTTGDLAVVLLAIFQRVDLLNTNFVKLCDALQAERTRRP